jgi:hypothetical protein
MKRRRDRQELTSVAKSTGILSDFRQALRALRRRTRFIPVSETGKYARDLQDILSTLVLADPPPEEGLRAVTEFFLADKDIYEACDDSNGIVGDVFNFDATNLFVAYASRIEDKPPIADLVLTLDRESDYGVRDRLLDRAAEFLPTEVLREMVDRLWKEGKSCAKPDEARSRFYRVQSLARQLKDGPLFEKACRAATGDPYESQSLEIARVYLDAGDPGTAREKIAWIPEDAGHVSTERDTLLLEILRGLGDRDGMKEVGWRMFSRYHSVDNLDTLISVLGVADRGRIVDETIDGILKEQEYSYSDIMFLLDLGRIDQADAYILLHAAQLDGDSYSELLKFAEHLEPAGKVLTCTLIYRALLDSILARGISKYYTHGVRYLRRLDQIAPLVTGWRGYPTHDAYMALLHQNHARKSAFWARYASPPRRSSRRFGYPLN